MDFIDWSLTSHRWWRPARFGRRRALRPPQSPPLTCTGARPLACASTWQPALSQWLCISELCYAACVCCLAMTASESESGLCQHSKTLVKGCRTDAHSKMMCVHAGRCCSTCTRSCGCPPLSEIPRRQFLALPGAPPAGATQPTALHAWTATAAIPSRRPGGCQHRCFQRSAGRRMRLQQMMHWYRNRRQISTLSRR